MTLFEFCDKHIEAAVFLAVCAMLTVTACVFVWRLTK